MVRRTADRSGWIVDTEAEVRAVLADERLCVPEVGPDDEPGTVGWLRAAVSRFVNGPAHARRRALLVAELDRIDPDVLAAAAAAEALARLDALPAGRRLDVMRLLARPAPAAALAGLLGARDRQSAADAVVACAAGYFPGAELELQRRADAGTRQLLRIFADLAPDVALARITLLVQGCDATAGLIGSALASGAGIEATLRDHPPVRLMRRVAHGTVELGGAAIRAGDGVVCDLEAASGPAVLTFGDGLRPCPGQAHARALAAAVAATVRETCGPVEQPVDYLPSAALHIPRQVFVTRR